MWKTQLLQTKKLSGGWGAVIIVLGAGLMLLFGQVTFPAQPGLPEAAAPNPSPTAVPTGAGEEEPASFLAEYDPDTVSLLDITDEAETERSGWELGTDLLLKLAVILGLIYLAMRGLHWLQRHKYHQLGKGATINVLETTGLAPGRSLHLVVVGEKTLLIGATEQQISLLAELSETAVAVPEPTAFDETLKLQEHNGHRVEAEVPDDIEAAVEYTSDWQTTLDNIRVGIRKMQESVRG